MDQQFWDEMYGETEQRFSGLPNDALIAEVAGMDPGQALDLGCGEGADAHWLAARGWQVTAVDISRVALERAAAAEYSNISWQHADIGTAPLPPHSFDLVSVHYFPLERAGGAATVLGLLETVAPGGTLLFVTHDPAEFPPPEEHPHRFDPYDYYLPADIVALLDDRWTVEVDESRDRDRPAAGHQVKDLVLRLRRAG